MKKEEYYKYLQSDEWKNVRKRFLNSKRYKGGCKCCGNKLKDSEVIIHHKTYRNVGDEKLRQLEAVCRDCHTKIHFKNGKKLKLNGNTLNNRISVIRNEFFLKKKEDRVEKRIMDISRAISLVKSGEDHELIIKTLEGVLRSMRSE